MKERQATPTKVSESQKSNDFKELEKIEEDLNGYINLPSKITVG